MNNDVLLLLLGAIIGFISAVVLALLNWILSLRTQHIKRIEQETDERMGLLFEFLSGNSKKGEQGAGESLPPVAWLVLNRHRGSQGIISWSEIFTSDQRVVLTNITTIGRDYLNTMVIPSRDVNRIHAIIRFESGKFVFYDLSGSKTTLSGKGNINKAILRDGDVIFIKGFEILYAEHESTITKAEESKSQFWHSDFKKDSMFVLDEGAATEEEKSEPQERKSER